MSNKLINIDSRADFINGSILSEKDLNSLFKKKYSAVFHFAALKAARASVAVLSDGPWAIIKSCFAI